MIRASQLSEAQLRAYALAENKLGEKAGWDSELLATELEELRVDLSELGLDLTATGFDPGEVDTIFKNFQEQPLNPADEMLEIADSAIVARTGDIFSLGQHRLAVGDAQDNETFIREHF